MVEISHGICKAWLEDDLLLQLWQEMSAHQSCVIIVIPVQKQTKQQMNEREFECFLLSEFLLVDGGRRCLQDLPGQGRIEEGKTQQWMVFVVLNQLSEVV